MAKGGGMGMHGGVHGRGACKAGRCTWQGGMHGMHAPPILLDTVGQCTGSTHSTGIHSCS